MALLFRLNDRIDQLFAAVCGSWLAAAAVILFVFAAATSLLDDFPIQPDGLRSIATAGYFDASPDLPSVFERLATVSQQHVPGYFVALFAWANLAGWDPLVLRLPSLFFGILSLALIYRLACDFIAREAGFPALVMLASLAFYNYWYLPIRMYTMFVAAELLLLWLYFRIVWRCRSRLREIVAFSLGCMLFLSTHIFSLASCLGVAAYHLIFVPKTRKWIYVAAAGIVAVLVFLPWIGTLLTGAVEIAEGEFGDIDVLGPVELAVTAIDLGINKSVLFLALLAISLREALLRDRASIALWVITVVAIAAYAIVNLQTDAIDLHRARYLVILFPLLILLLVKGIMSIWRWKPLPLIILMFWIASGLLYQRRVGAVFFVRSYNTIPVHLIERLLRDELSEGDLILGWTEGLNFDYQTPYGGVADYYFARHAVTVVIEHNYQLGQIGDDEIVTMLADELVGHDRVWLAYELDNMERYLDLFQLALSPGFERCATEKRHSQRGHRVASKRGLQSGGDESARQLTRRVDRQDGA